MFQLTIPLHVISESNSRCHWAVKAKRVKEQRTSAAVYIRFGLMKFQRDGKDILPPFSVTLTRIGKRLLDGDNLQGAFKATRDGIADALKVNDGDVRMVEWKYAQEVRDYYAVKIEICGMIPATVTGGKSKCLISPK